MDSPSSPAHFIAVKRLQITENIALGGLVRQRI
jgi:hypothetical protein